MPSDDELTARYYVDFAAAYVRATLGLPFDQTPPLEVLRQGLDREVRLVRFKRNMELPRVKRVLGALAQLAPRTLLDIGSGRGTFLWPLLEAFPSLNVTSVEQDAQRAELLERVTAGGIDRLDVVRADAAALDFEPRAFDIVTILEVLEHAPTPAALAREAVRVAQRFVVASVPSHEDDNPEHLHLLDKPTLEKLFLEAGARRVTFDYVLNHLIAIIRTSD